MNLTQFETKIIQLFGVCAILLVAVGSTVYFYLSQPSRSEAGQARLMSLGEAKGIKSKTDKEKQVLLNDPAVQHNWGLMGTGGASDINASRAWKITQGSRDIVVAVIDTGIDVKHEDLKNNLWTNKGETGFDERGRDKSTNGIDDDKNGYVDDVHGYNFVSETGDLTDNHGHGTHVSGIVGAEGGNGVGISGVAPKVSIMTLKYFDPLAKGTDNLRNTIRAIHYAIKMKANIINYSGGGLEFSHDEYKAVKLARDHGILFVAAAGNERSNSDKAHYYPANYDLDNIVSVTAINPSANVLKSSNWGVNTVHLAAPGEHIFSTLPKNQYGMMTGTSQATAFATGVAALILANNKDFNYRQVRKQIISTADEISTIRSKTKTSGKLNSWAALAMQPPIPLSGIADADATPASSASYTLGSDSGALGGPSSQLRDLARFREILNQVAQ